MGSVFEIRNGRIETPLIEQRLTTLETLVARA